MRSSLLAALMIAMLFAATVGQAASIRLKDLVDVDGVRGKDLIG